MGRALETAMGAALVLLLPSLVTTDTPAVLGIAVAAMALVVLVRFGACFGVLAARIPTAACASRRHVLTTLSGRATDPVHHPLRPRAPGTA